MKTILINCCCWFIFSRAQSYAVQLPGDFVCEDCTIRLLREALEWGNSYRFWSCADVDIKNSNFFLAYICHIIAIITRN